MMNRRTRKLRRENKKARENLTYSNQFELDHIMAYFDGAPITDYQREEIHRDLIAMLSDGQARGVRTKDVVGEEPLDFCNAILAEIEPPPPSHNVFRFLRAFFLYTFVYSLSFFLMYQMIPWARGANEDKIYLTILNVANLFLMAFAIEAARRWNNKRVRTTHLWKAVLALWSSSRSISSWVLCKWQ